MLINYESMKEKGAARLQHDIAARNCTIVRKAALRLGPDTQTLYICRHYGRIVFVLISGCGSSNGSAKCLQPSQRKTFERLAKNSIKQIKARKNTSNIALVETARLRDTQNVATNCPIKHSDLIW